MNSSADWKVLFFLFFSLLTARTLRERKKKVYRVATQLNRNNIVTLCSGWSKGWRWILLERWVTWRRSRQKVDRASARFNPGDSPCLWPCQSGWPLWRTQALNLCVTLSGSLHSLTPTERGATPLQAIHPDSCLTLQGQSGITTALFPCQSLLHFISLFLQYHHLNTITN